MYRHKWGCLCRRVDVALVLFIIILFRLLFYLHIFMFNYEDIKTRNEFQRTALLVLRLHSKLLLEMSFLASAKALW
jgi:hypothetical protein